MRSGFLLAIAAYAAVLWAAGLRLPGRGGGIESFFLASRRLGAGRVAFSLCASWIGAASLLVSMDEASRDGLSAVWIIGSSRRGHASRPHRPRQTDPRRFGPDSVRAHAGIVDQFCFQGKVQVKQFSFRILKLVDFFEHRGQHLCSVGLSIEEVT